MDNVELAVRINKAVINYEYALEDKVDKNVAADILIDEVLNILADAGISGQIEPEDEYETKTIPIKYFKLSNSVGSDIIASNNDEIYAYTD